MALGKDQWHGHFLKAQITYVIPPLRTLLQLPKTCRRKYRLFGAQHSVLSASPTLFLDLSYIFPVTLAFPQRWQAHSYFRAFALTLPWSLLSEVTVGLLALGPRSPPLATFWRQALLLLFTVLPLLTLHHINLDHRRPKRERNLPAFFIMLSPEPGRMAGT